MRLSHRDDALKDFKIILIQNWNFIFGGWYDRAILIFGSYLISIPSILQKKNET